MQSSRIPYFVLLLLGGAGLPGGDLAAQAPAQGVTLAQFRQLSWLHGRWRGSGGAYPAFYEEYRPVNDSTIQMRSFRDSTFTTATDSSRIELRNGSISSRGSGSPSLALEVTPTRIHFMPAGASRGGYTFTRVSADEWKATLHPAKAGGAETVYVMRRVRR